MAALRLDDLKHFKWGGGRRFKLPPPFDLEYNHPLRVMARKGELFKFFPTPFLKKKDAPSGN